MVIKTIPKKKKCKKAEWLSEEALQIAEKRREKQWSKGKTYPFESRVPKKRIWTEKKAFLSDPCKEIEENNRREGLEISSRKLRIPREHFMQRWAQ